MTTPHPHQSDSRVPKFRPGEIGTVHILETTDGRVVAVYGDMVSPAELFIADALQRVVDWLQERGC